MIRSPATDPAGARARTARWRNTLLIAGGAVLAMVLPYVFTGLAARSLLILTAINVILVVSLDLLIGLTGLLSLGHAAFWGVGAYASALTAMRLGFPFPLALLAAIAAGALAGAIVGAPALRLRGHHFSVVTFIIGIIVTILMTNLVGLTRGPMGLPGIPFASLHLFGWSHTFMTIVYKVGFYHLTLFFVALALLLRWRIAASRLGRALKAIKADEDLARAIGIQTFRVKLTVFCVSAAVAGAAGSLYAHYTAFISPDSFTFVESFDLFVMNLVGGAGTALGPIIGPAFLTSVGTALRSVSPVLAEIIYGALLIVSITLLPTGIVGGTTALARRWRRRR
ncbi:MAG: branched-chain amino acid ABC transporter permease [Deinococcales bacterium]